ncbi:MAG: SLC13 family permease [Acidimicrobiia bacterium]
MSALRIAALVVAIAGVLLRPRNVPAWAVPLLMVTVTFCAGAVHTADMTDALDPLRSPLAFLLLAVPLAVMLDRLGFFVALAARYAGGSRPPRSLVRVLWILAALVTTVLNLDAAVVLLTPLYIRIARVRGLDPLLLAYQPALMACLASSALPVSNLTNLIAAERYDLHMTDFVSRLALPSVVAVVVAWFVYVRIFPFDTASSRVDHADVDPVALRRGTPVVVFVVIGFTLGDTVGVPAWMVAAVADVWLLSLVRRVPWRAVPIGAALVASALGILAATAAPHLGLTGLATWSGAGANVAGFGASVLGANAVNNLPALLIAVRVLPSSALDDGLLWCVLYGVNVGPGLIVSGSLAGLLWLDASSRLGVQVDARAYTRLGVRIALPAIVASAAVLVVLLAVTNG